MKKYKAAAPLIHMSSPTDAFFAVPNRLATELLKLVVNKLIPGSDLNEDLLKLRAGSTKFSEFENRWNPKIATLNSDMHDLSQEIEILRQEFAAAQIADSTQDQNNVLGRVGALRISAEDRGDREKIEQLTSLQSELEQKQGKPNVVITQLPKWSCSACTFLNMAENESCAMCGSSRPASSLPEIDAKIATRQSPQRAKNVSFNVSNGINACWMNAPLLGLYHSTDLRQMFECDEAEEKRSLSWLVFHGVDYIRDHNQDWNTFYQDTLGILQNRGIEVALDTRQNETGDAHAFVAGVLAELPDIQFHEYVSVPIDRNADGTVADNSQFFVKERPQGRDFYKQWQWGHGARVKDELLVQSLVTNNVRRNLQEHREGKHLKLVVYNKNCGDLTRGDPSRRVTRGHFVSVFYDSEHKKYRSFDAAREMKDGQLQGGVSDEKLDFNDLVASTRYLACPRGQMRSIIAFYHSDAKNKDLDVALARAPEVEDARKAAQRYHSRAETLRKNTDISKTEVLRLMDNMLHGTDVALQVSKNILNDARKASDGRTDGKTVQALSAMARKVGFIQSAHARILGYRREVVDKKAKWPFSTKQDRKNLDSRTIQEIETLANLTWPEEKLTKFKRRLIHELLEEKKGNSSEATVALMAIAEMLKAAGLDINNESDLERVYQTYRDSNWDVNKTLDQLLTKN